MAMNMTYKFSDIFKVLAVLTKFVVLDYSFDGDDHVVSIDGHDHERDLPIDDQVVDIDDYFVDIDDHLLRKSPRNIRRPWLP